MKLDLLLTIALASLSTRVVEAVPPELTRADLPPIETRRWVASRKAKVVKAVTCGLIPLADALERYGLSEEEFALWREAVEQHGETALKVTAIQKFRQL